MYPPAGGKDGTSGEGRGRGRGGGGGGKVDIVCDAVRKVLEELDEHK